MNLIAKFTNRFRSRLAGAGLTILCGLGLWSSRAGDGLVHLSYDLPFIFSPKEPCDELMIIKMDQQAYRDLKQEWGKGWDRSLHAQLLNKLKVDESDLVVFDIWFEDKERDPSDSQLTEAIKSHGMVVLPSIFDPMSNPWLSGKSTELPWDDFLNAAGTNWGISEVFPDSDSVVRAHFQGTEPDPSIAWKAAELAGATVTRNPSNRFLPRWLRYYGPDGTLPSISYPLALNQPRDFFRGKYIFIGGTPRSHYGGEKVDEFRTPFTRLGNGEKTPGVEINATMFLNLMRGDWLSRLSWQQESALFLVVGAALGFGLAQIRPMVATGLAALAFILIALAAIILFWKAHVWFSWMIMGGAQVPFALAWAVLTYTKTLSHEKEVLTHEKEVLQIQLETASHGAPTQLPRPLTPAGGTRRVPLVHDHKLLRCIGRGAYGEVWLAVNAIGLYHGVKIVERSKFQSTEPYDREFKGVEKYMPISLNHPGLVRILQVGRSDEAGYFYYVMEIGDDEATGTKINPESYSPRTLAKDLDRRRRLPVSECVSLGLALTDALEFLHQQQLIHRDIKPSNIIFVKDVPKLADLGLVTNIEGPGKSVTFVGTEGYIAPEGPGSPAGDVYSLGKVLYEAATGLNRNQFPLLPSSIVADGSTVHLIRLNSIIVKACEADLRARYKSAAELRVWLLDLERHLNS